jgi:hypothetical protein
MNFIATTGTDLHTFLVKNQQIDLALTLKFRSKVKFENIFKFLGYDFLYLVNTIFCNVGPCVAGRVKMCTLLGYLHAAGSSTKVCVGPLPSPVSGF